MWRRYIYILRRFVGRVWLVGVGDIAFFFFFFFLMAEMWGWRYMAGVANGNAGGNLSFLFFFPFFPFSAYSTRCQTIVYAKLEVIYPPLQQP